MQDHRKRLCQLPRLASPLFPKACKELPCLVGLLTRPSLSPSHTDGPYSGFYVTGLTRAHSSGHCCRFAQHSLDQIGRKGKAFFRNGNCNSQNIISG